MKSASVNAAGRLARMAMAAMSFARRLFNGARMAPRPGAIAQSTHVWRFTKFQPAICRLRSFCGCGEPPRRNAEKIISGVLGEAAGGRFVFLAQACFALPSHVNLNCFAMHLLTALDFANRIIQRDFPLRAFVAPNVGNPQGCSTLYSESGKQQWITN
jgi:hypothetical protein